MLDVKSTAKGILIPRMTSAERVLISSPASGLLVYDVTTASFWYYAGSSWINLSMPPAVLSDADNDTRIQVEESPDDDVIRFDIGGTENMKLLKNTYGEAWLEIINESHSIGIGANALVNNQADGVYNTALGDSTLHFNTTGDFNTAIGNNALKKNTAGIMNTGIGGIALYSNTTGYNNTAVGMNALYSNIGGSSNIAIGNAALYNNTSESGLVAIGDSALFLGTGACNTAVGNKTLRYEYFRVREYIHRVCSA